MADNHEHRDFLNLSPDPSSPEPTSPQPAAPNRPRTRTRGESNPGEQPTSSNKTTTTNQNNGTPRVLTEKRKEVEQKLRQYASDGSIDAALASTIAAAAASTTTTENSQQPPQRRPSIFNRRTKTSPEPQNSPRPRPERKGSNIVMEEVLGGPIRHLTSAPSLLMVAEPDTRHVLMNVEDQRHPGKTDAKIHSTTRQIDTLALEKKASQRDQEHQDSNKNNNTTVTANDPKKNTNTNQYGSVASRLSSRTATSSRTAASSYSHSKTISSASSSSSYRRQHPPEFKPEIQTSSEISPALAPQQSRPPPIDEDITKEAAAAAAAATGPESQYITGIPLLCIIIGLMLAVFLISIDRTIISTAIPYITAEFHSTPDIGWYGSSYLLTACAFQPVFGRIFMLFDVKKAYLLAMFLFELGSLVCGVAPTSMALIVGRAIAGFGCAGVLTGSFVVVGTAVPLRMRPLFMGVVGVMFGVGATCGPLLGGVFTDLVTWRWCFYINLPVGGATVIAMILFFHPKKTTHAARTFWDRFLDLDIIGNVLLLGASVMLFLALEYTTLGVPWNSAEIIGLLVGFGVTSILFSGWQRWKGDDALMPPRIVSQRTVAASCGMAFMTYGALINLTFFLPIWFQAIKGDSAITSGVNMIPYFVTNAFFSLFAGVFVSVIGYVTPPAVIGSAIGTAGLGLLTMLNVNTTTAQWVGYEILSSAGFGLSIQQGFTAVQTVLGPEDMAIGTATVVASQSLGGAIFLSVGNSVFQSQLQKASGSIPGVDIKKVIDSGATAFRHIVPVEQLPALLEVYNKALRVVFTVSIPLGGLAALISCFLEWKSVKVKKDDVVEKERVNGMEEDEVDVTARGRASIGGWA